MDAKYKFKVFAGDCESLPVKIKYPEGLLRWVAAILYWVDPSVQAPLSVLATLLSLVQDNKMTVSVTKSAIFVSLTVCFRF